MTSCESPRPVRWLLLLTVGVLLSFALAETPHQQSIAPLIESDYAYQLIAADRLYAGQGLTSLPPVAPHQPWQWEHDWSYLTQWPAGYAVAVCLVRSLTGGSSVDAAHWISVFACAFALVGWFAVGVRLVPHGGTRYFLAAVMSGLAVPAASLINPSTDAIVVAILPFLILAMSTTPAPPTASRDGRATDADRPVLIRLALIGLVAGSLVWIRYAAVFVSAGIGLYLLVVWLVSRRVTLRHVWAFALGAGMPVALLLMVNRVMSSSASVQTQMNLGVGASAHFSWSLVTTAWGKWTTLGWYDYRPGVGVAFAWWPLVLAVAVAVSPRTRRAIGRWWMRTPAVGVSVCLVTALLTMLITATAIYGEKFHYVGLDRYYLPVKPLYGLLFAAPLLWVPIRGTKVILNAALSLGLLFMVQVSWSRTLQRWQAADRPATPYGAWSRAFEPGATSLFGWLRNHHDPSLVIVSNFHEFVTLETGIPTLPIPPDRKTLDRWLEDIAAARHVGPLHVVFALDPDNRWRDYWLPEPSGVRERFSLSPYEIRPGVAVDDYLYAYPTPETIVADIGHTTP